MARFKNHTKLSKLALFLVAILALLFAKTLYQVLTAPTIKAVDLEQIALFFNPDEYSGRYNKGVWEKYSKCAGLFCWSYYTLSPLFPHFIEVNWVMGANIFHLFKEELGNSPYKGHSIRRDRIYNIYWIDDYGPFKINITKSQHESVPTEVKIRPYDRNTDNPRMINDISWDTSLSRDTYIISPHLIIHREGKSPEIVAYKDGNKIVVKDVFEYGGTWTVISGEIALNHLPPGDYEILYISNENGIPNTDAGTSDTIDIVGYTKFSKE